MVLTSQEQNRWLIFIAVLHLMQMSNERYMQLISILLFPNRFVINVMLLQKEAPQKRKNKGNVKLDSNLDSQIHFSILRFHFSREHRFSFQNFDKTFNKWLKNRISGQMVHSLTVLAKKAPCDCFFYGTCAQLEVIIAN